MDIIKEFQKYPHAWDAFLEWRKEYSPFRWNEFTDPVSGAQLRYLLADMQAWLDSVGMYCDAFWVVDKFFAYADKKNVEMWQSKNGFPTRPEALKAAVLKGFEIFENSKTQ